MFFSKIKKQSTIQNRRSFLLLTGKFIFLSLIGSKLFSIQILNSKKYQTLSKKNQIDFEILYPLRGQILDRNDIILATNKNTYDLYLNPKQVINIEETLNKLSKYIDLDFTTKRKIIALNKKSNNSQNIKILKDINWKNLELIEAYKTQLPGLHLQIVPRRVYPYNAYLSHVLGYTNKPSEKDLDLPFIDKMPSLDIGKAGIEKILNEQLIGYPGKREIEVNAFGKEIREISKQKSVQGQNINISIDLKLQELVYDQLKKHKAGSIVVLDITSGEILSMISIPDYDPNLIIKKPNQKYWDNVLKNPLSPLTNRSIQGLYAPGSTFKMIVALAGLKKGVIDNKKTVFCEGKIEYGDRFYHCWKKKGHGKVNLTSAITESCDVFFYELAKNIGIDDIAKTAKEFGFGEVTNIALENEKKGIMPSKKWKKINLKQNWYAGETLNAGIGQGYTLSTPLQLAIMTARIASEGEKIEPTIFKDQILKKFKKINLNKKHIEIIKNGMFKVVNEARGTAFKSRSNSYKYSGKTGTSQVRKITMEERESEDFRKKEIEWKNRDHAIFVGYMPSENPKYAISVVVEHGGSGASTAAPIAKNIFDYLYKMKKA